MTHSYRKLLKPKTFISAALVLCMSMLAACGSSSPSSSDSGSDASNSPIKLGVLEDRSGDFALVGMQKYHAAELAVDEINKSGGLLGRQIEIVAPDTQSDNQRYQEMARKLILEDKVDVVMGGYTSASREAIRPIMEQNKMLYFYNNQYEGGVASKYTFATGAVPEHQVVTLIKSMIKKYGPNIYTIAADYNFGQITAQWVKKTAEENGGKIIGEEFIPLSVSQFSSTISKIQQAKPDVLVTLLVGVPQSSFYEQWSKSGIKGLPMATTVNMAQAYEHKRFKPPALANMYVTATFMEELETPEAKAFVKKWREKFPDEPYIGMEAEAQYTGVYLWAEAVKKAGTVEKEAVIKALESGISVDSPSGKTTIDPKTHHAIKNVYLAHADENHKITFPETFENVVPDWLSKEKGVDLTTKADNKQYTPLDK
ncbi:MULTISPECIES: urea ABC transporter substrate-binding protein [Paenibacillus]|uniref:ABC transporter substrate-binding protein n=3 Tax=Bacilli TaxID=91061 RepID=A0A0U2W709_9BACL|nr:MULTISPECIES: urea ABC transporter substrate-binding protein [Paenibacillus]ALS24324.1 ABC transporter substrate-binding protein [Paenibacillus naphthalenovorans]GCL73784.1 urea ABC transporter substrate-binding protein [Paenibacillus naphthalenovorans]SDI53925.1 branched-chain amino acid transport system substrate-binding protein [Paenibacillus naphthalenovorans]